MKDEKINQQDQLNRISERFDEVGIAEIITGEEHEFYNEMQAQLSNSESLNQVSYELLDLFQALDLSFIELCILFQNIKEEAAWCFGSRARIDEMKEYEEECEAQLKELSIDSIAEIAEEIAERE